MTERSLWTGSAADLLRVSLDRSSDRISRSNAGWPKNPRALSGHLRRAQTFLRTVGIDIGMIGAGGLAWAVFAPTVGAPAGALAGEYVGASGDVAVGAGIGANVLIGGSQRSIALQPVSLEGSVALNVTLGLSALQLRYVP